MVLKVVEIDEVSFFLEYFYNMFNSWLKEDNICDWCIFCQLWWGQCILAWYYEDKIFVVEMVVEVLDKVWVELGKLDL